MASFLLSRVVTLMTIFISCIAFVPSIPSLKKSISSTKHCSSSQEEWFKRKGAWDAKDLAPLLDANKAWAARTRTENPGLFDSMKLPHAPKILWIGCADARVPANEMIGEPPGSVFVHRNIANNVIVTDFNSMSVLQYAIDYLKVRHIIVCGHLDCGGVKAALSAFDHKAPLENWLQNIRDVIRLHQKELGEISDITERQSRLVELNAKEQALNLFKTTTVQKRREETRRAIEEGSTEYEFVEPQIHALVYDPKTGLAKKMTLNTGDDAADSPELRAFKMYDKSTALATVTPAAAAPVDDSGPKKLELDFGFFTLRLFSQ